MAASSQSMTESNTSSGPVPLPDFLVHCPSVLENVPDTESCPAEDDEPVGPQSLKPALRKRAMRSRPSRKRNKNPSKDDPNPRRRPRKTYTDKEKRMVIDADARDGRMGRHAVAHAIGMPENSADSIISRARHEDVLASADSGAAHDTRRDGTARRGKGKRHEWQVDLMLRMLYQNATLELQDLRGAINRESLRRIAHDLGLLSADEAKEGADLRVDALLTNTEVKKFYREAEVRSDETVRKWLLGVPVSRKHLVPEKAIMNSTEAVSKRLEHARWLKRALQHDKVVVVFEDEMPFHVTVPGSRRNSQRNAEHDVFKTAGGHGGVAIATQVAMAVAPKRGLIYGDVSSPGKQVKLTKDGKRGGGNFKGTWNRETFVRFLTGMLRALFEHAEAYKGKHVFIVLGGTPELGSDDNLAMLVKEADEAVGFSSKMEKLGGKALLVQTPPNSPQLNLCEHYNRSLWSKTVANRNVLGEFQHGDGERMERRVTNTLNRMVRDGMDDFKSPKESSHMDAMRTLQHFLDKVIAADGLL